MKKVLVVDDSGFMRTLIKKHLKFLDVEVIGEAEDGKEAIEKYIELNPDIVTLDLAMLDHDGIEALEGIMGHDPNAKVIIVASTAGQNAVVDEAKALGAHAIISKPLKDDAFVNAIKELL